MSETDVSSPRALATARVTIAAMRLKAARTALAAIQPSYMDAQQRVADALQGFEQAQRALDLLTYGEPLYPVTVSSLLKRSGWQTGNGNVVSPMSERLSVATRRVDDWTVAVWVYGSERAFRTTNADIALGAIARILLDDGRFVVRRAVHYGSEELHVSPVPPTEPTSQEESRGDPTAAESAVPS